jgi:hypothetical protein
MTAQVGVTKLHGVGEIMARRRRHSQNIIRKRSALTIQNS